MQKIQTHRGTGEKYELAPQDQLVKGGASNTVDKEMCGENADIRTDY